MADKFLYSLREHEFLLKEWLDIDKVFNLPPFRDGYSADDLDMIFDEALKVAREIIAPTNAEGDKIGAKLEDGQVRMPECFHKMYRFVQENGYGNSQYDPDDEGRLPCIVHSVIEECFTAANPSFHPYTNLAGGAAKLIRLFGTDRERERFLPSMYEGKWSGTMCLTEPGAGSDVGYITTQAQATDEPGVYHIKGQKLFITAGDHDLTENIIHLLLARCEGGAPGTKGISLFVVPKYWVNEDGSLGENNGVTTVSLEHKLGLRGASTTTLSFGEDAPCRGILLGNAPDENGAAQGMSQMFVMMNGARHSTGLAAMAMMQAAYNYAADYAKERVQGRPLSKKGDRVRIIEHEDVRNMLMLQRAYAEASRAMVYKNAYCMDLAEHSEDNQERAWAQASLEVTTPLVKGFPTDNVWQIIGQAIQVYGGYGYTEEYPVAQYARDCKIYSIWEGTTYIQSMDLVRRKWSLEGGGCFARWWAELKASVEASRDLAGFQGETELLVEAMAEYETIKGEVQALMAEDISRAAVYFTRILNVTAMIWGSVLLLEQAAVAAAHGDGEDGAFYFAKGQTAKYFIRNTMPEVFKLARQLRTRDDSPLMMPEEAF